MERAVRKAGKGLARDFGEVEHLQVSVKGPSDFVSTADLAAERALRAELEKARPGYSFLMEESGVSHGTDRDHVWIVDPLDGTTNFLHSIPHFAISVALQHRGELLAGMIYNPVLDELYWAEKGKGAYLNDRRLRVSGRRDLGESLIGTGIPFRGRGKAEDHAHYLKLLAATMARTAGVRRPGAAALDLAYVAAGRFDGFFEIGLNKWDVAAGILLIREAGGFVGDMDGDAEALETGNIVAGNAKLFEPLRGFLREHGGSGTAR
ncbi:MAG: inositol monophosphatase [Azospirillum sp.]|nr:inositol monophosphatase [Azospirillum sp.]MCA3267020.1 inositol monophosphatase [Azospirillum sp.]